MEYGVSVNRTIPQPQLYNDFLPSEPYLGFGGGWGWKSRDGGGGVG